MMDIGWAGNTPGYFAEGRQPPFEIDQVTKENAGRAIITTKPEHRGVQIYDFIDIDAGEHREYELVRQ
jgi:hypothetical protein